LIKEWDRIAPLMPITKYSGHATASSSAWSPDGNQILAELNENYGSGIYVMNVDGSDIGHLTPNFLTSSSKSDPVWSPDGRNISYIDISWSNEQNIYRMNTDGSDPINLTNNAFFVWEFDWSPDAKRIVFVSQHSVRDNSGAHDRDIYTMDFDGSNVNQLTQTASDENHPKWSPDGSYIAFISASKSTSHPDYDDQDLSLMDADGSNVTQISTTHGVSSFAWSPDGKKLAFSSTNSNPPYESDLYLVDVDGSNITQLPGVPEATHPAWSPDGAQIALYSNDAIYVINSDGANVKLLANVSYPKSLNWSPDGRLIMFISDSAIFVMNADGSDKVQLTNPPSYYVSPPSQ
jgi:TolB protein